MDTALQAAGSYERNAIHNFFIDVTLPIITQIGDQFAVIGTGTLFKIAGFRFLITANHIADDFPVEQWAFPSAHDTGTLQTFGCGDLIRPNDDAYDVCVLQLLEPEVIEILDRGWRFLTLDNVWIPDHSAQAVYLSGFPSIRAKWDGEKLSGRMFVVPTTYYLEPPASVQYSDSPVKRGVDFFLEFKKSANELTGEDISNEKMQGTSGCSIWAYREQGWGDPYSVWTPEVPLKVIGVQSRYLKNEYLRGKSWGTVLRLLSLLGGPVSEEARMAMKQMLHRMGYPEVDD